MTPQSPCNLLPIRLRYPNTTPVLRQVFAFCLALFSGALAWAQSPAPVHPVRDFGKVPLSFEPNRGQMDSQVQFLSRGQGYALYLSAGQAVLELQKATPADAAAKTSAAPVKAESATLAMKLAGAKQDAVADAQDLLPGTVNYFIGNDPAKWHTALPTYGRVAFRGVYRGVDLVYYGNQRELEYDFVLSPGADAAAIGLEFTGATPKIDRSGDLVLAVAGDETRFGKPAVYQMAGDRKVPVEGRYRITDGKVGFALGNYDHTRTLVIDPILSYLTYLGGSTNDLINGVAVDSAGEAYVVARSLSSDYPIKNAYQSSNAALIVDSRNSAIAVTKFNAAGTALVYSTYLNGTTSQSLGYGIAVDSSGNAYVGGYTQSSDYPVTPGAYQTLCGGNYQVSGSTVVRVPGCGTGSANGVLTKLDPTGTMLVYSTFLGGNDFNGIYAVAVDASGQAYVTGTSNANCGPGPYYPNPSNPNVVSCQSYDNFPITTGSAQDSTNQTITANNFAFLTKFNAAGSALLYSSILGVYSGYSGSVQGAPQGLAVALDASGNAYIGGVTSRYLYTTTGAYQTAPGGTSGVRAFAAKFDTVGQKLVYSTYLNGTDNTSNVGEQVNGIAADAAGNAYLAGSTSECSFPTTAGAYQVQARYPAGTPSAACNAGFVAKLNPTGSALVWSTFLGDDATNAENTSLNALALGSDGSVYVAGQESGGGYPLVNPIQTQTDYNTKAIITRLNSAGSALLFSTTLGSATAATDLATGLAVDGSGNIYVAGQTNGSALPVTSGAFQTTNKTPGGNSSTGFVAKIAPTAATTTTLTLPSGTVTAGQTAKLTAKVTGQTGSTGAPTGIVTFLNGTTTVGTGTLDATATATFTASALSATTYSLSASYAGDTSFSGSVSVSQNLIVTALTPTVALTAPATAVVGASVTLATTVSGTGATPTGMVTFKDGSTTIGTATLASGAASISTSSLAIGAHSITVAYIGDSMYASAVSTAITVTINVAAAISFAAAPTSLTITHGMSGSVVITGTPVGGYTGTVSFACGTLPTAATCSFSPATLTFSGNNTAQSSTLTISTTTTAALQRPNFGKASSGIVLACLFMPLALLVRKRKQVWPSALLLLALTCSSLAIFGLSGCASSAAKGPTTVTTPAGSYTVAVTVTAAGGTSTINIPITVQ